MAISGTQAPSVRRGGLARGLRLAVLALAALILGVGAVGALASREAAREVAAARAAFERLETVRAVEAAFVRYLLVETERRLAGQPGAAETAEAARLRGALLTMRRDAESAAARGGVEAARPELIGAVALGQLFERIETEAMLDRAGLGGGPPAERARAFLTLIASDRDQTFSAVVADTVERERARAAAAFARLEALGRRIAFWGAALGLGALAAAALFARGFQQRLVRPIEGLAEAAAAFGAGSRQARAPAGLPPEFAPLGARFDAMAERIAGEQARLETEVASRTRELAVANESLRAVDARRRRFFAALSHEVRTPVTALLGEAQVALRAGGEGEAREALGRVAASGGYLRRRLDDLLSLARSEDGALSLTLASCDLSDAARGAAETARGYAAVAEAALTVEVPAEPVEVRGDVEALRQAALALIDNAVKMSPPGGTVAIRVERGGGSARLVVEDDGPGFAEGEAASVFAPYAQGKAGRRAGGAGLGLAVTRWIVEQHGGEAGAETRPGGGARVWLRVPA